MSKPWGLMSHDERMEWADDHGYMRYRCPGCHQTFYSDSGPEGNCSCGYETPQDEEPSDDEH